MAMSGYLLMTTVALGGLLLFLPAWAWARRRHRRAAARGATAAPAGKPQGLRLEQRMEAVEGRLGELAARQAGGASEEKMQAMAGSLLALVRDKNAAMDTALAGLDQLRARMRALEQMGDVAETRALFDGLGARIDAAQAAQAAGEAALGARLAALEASDPGGALAGQFARLMEHKDAAIAALLDRLGPLEARLDELRGAQSDAAAALAALRAEAGSTAKLAARVQALEAAERDPRTSIDALAARLEASQAAYEARMSALEAPAENPFAEIAEQLTRLYAQKDTAVETVLGRLAPLEARLAALEGAERDPRAALEAFALRLDGLQARLKDLETSGENPFAEISEQLTRLYAQKDATVQAVFTRLAPLEARLGAIEAAVETRDPRQALDGFATRLEAVKAAHEARLAALEMPGESPFAEISGQLTALYAQKDAAVEAVMGRLAPLEARLAAVEQGAAERDPRAALEAFAARLEALQARLVAVEAPGENPFAEISEQLTRLYAQKDATVETVLGRLAPLEARLGSIEAEIAPRVAALEAADPRAGLAEIAARVAALQAAQGAAGERLEALQAAMGAVPPIAEISDQLARLNAQKDAAVEAVAARLAPIEVRLAELEARPVPESAEEARAEAQEIAAQMIALRAAAAQTELFADRLALLEASLPRLSSAQALMLQALERQGVRPPIAADPVPATAEPAAAPAADPVRADLPDLPRVVSLHHG